MANVLYKGKQTDKSWRQLPANALSRIAHFHLALHREQVPVARMWSSSPYSRALFLVLRDAPVMEMLLNVCTPWAIALESHPFWAHAAAIMDPQHMYDHYQLVRAHNSSSLKLSPCRHFLNLRNLACFVCRVNYPTHSFGISLAKRTALAFSTGQPIALCRDHSKRAAFCALCLRSAPPAESRDAYDLCIYENEDDESWPGLEATCRWCRQDELLARVASCDQPQRMLDALGGQDLASDDWETRLAVENFLDLAEGLISDVLNVAQEKYWLRRHTKLDDVLNNAVAAVRFCRRDSLEEDEEEDTEAIYQDEERNGVRDIVLCDWARLRILDGLWVSPADQWYQHRVPDEPFCVPAVHPLPWLMDEEAPEHAHPSQKLIDEELAPTFALCETLYIAYRRQMRSVLLPAMVNLVRKVVIECTEDGIDPALRACRMSIEHVVDQLRQEGVWYNGIDWLERRRNFRREQQDSTHSPSSSVSSLEEEEGSHATSPVLSTTTVQTTPSPPPDKDKELAGANVRRKVPPIPVAAVEETPRLLQSIPYIPQSIAHLPHYSLDALKVVWREACAPLYHCRCSICERAMIKAGGQLPPPQPPPQVSTPIATRPALPKTVKGEEEVSETELSSFDSIVSDGEDTHPWAPQPITPPRPRKRSCESPQEEIVEVEGEGDDDDEEEEEEEEEEDSLRSPLVKRARVELGPTPLHLSRRPSTKRAHTPSPPTTAPAPYPFRFEFYTPTADGGRKKRGSEELETTTTEKEPKRVRVVDQEPPWEDGGLYTMDD